MEDNFEEFVDYAKKKQEMDRIFNEKYLKFKDDMRNDPEFWPKLLAIFEGGSDKISITAPLEQEEIPREVDWKTIADRWVFGFRVFGLVAEISLLWYFLS